MSDPSLRAFADPDAHEQIAAIIRRRSTHPEDVREVLLRGLDLSSAREILDLGCGFGFMAEALAPRVAPDARFLGVDACVANAVPFLQRAGRARFESRRLTDSLPWPDAHFDLVVCSYSLYFFPAVLPEIARVLRPDGRLLVLTHSVRSFVELLAAAGLDPERSPLLALVCRFPAEGAEDRLSRHFAEVDRVDYPNALRFGPDDLAEAETYLRFKLPLLHGAAPEAPELLASARAAIQSWLRAHGELLVTKDDAGFRCRRPRPGGS